MFQWFVTEIINKAHNTTTIAYQLIAALQEHYETYDTSYVWREQIILHVTTGLWKWLHGEAIALEYLSRF